MFGKLVTGTGGRLSTATARGARVGGTRNYFMQHTAAVTARSSNSPLKVSVRHASIFNHIELAPKDPIFGVNDAFNNDSDKRKHNVSIGAYRDNDGRSLVLPVVRQAERDIVDEGLDMEYTPIGGTPKFNKLAIELQYGPDNELLAENRVAALQTLSGTGALKIACDFIKKFLDEESHNVYCPDPTYANHLPILKHAGLNHKKYRYFFPKTNGLDFDGMIADLRAAPKKSTVMLHAVAHNPTGVDPDEEQWAQISQVCKEREFVVLFDSAYQGFASGDLDRDAFAVRQFAKDGHTLFVAQSFAKNFGLYGNRVGCLSVICDNAEEKACVDSQLRILARASYSSPPMHGSRIVERVLSDPQLTAQWREEVKMMSDRIMDMRDTLKSNLKAQGSELNWDHITEQIGMFCYTGLSPDQCDKLTKEWHIFLTRNGRISMAGVNSSNVEYLAEAIHAVSQ